MQRLNGNRRVLEINAIEKNKIGSQPQSFTNNTISEKNATKTNKFAAILCVVIVVVAIQQCIIHGASMATFLRGTPIGSIFLYASAALMSFAFIELIWRAVLVLMYKPIAGCEDDLLPGCTVIVPAYNEGKQVFVTLQSLAASDYPKDKLKLIAVDDGSVDDTWEWIKKAKELLGDSVITIKQPCNKGKRHALYEGFKQSEGEVLVTVDSDSTVDADTLRNLVSPFVVDKNVGAVAGNVRVLNMDKGIIPKMLDVVFVYSFDFIRASHSMVKAVMCTPGALSAYRKDIVMSILDEWLHQKFCGQPANIGEDRAMTNLILREGYHVLFQQNAKVYTEVPVKYTNLSKMYLRWARSNVRETIAMTRFIFKPFREGSKLGARINLISGWIAITKAQIFLVITWGLIILHPMTFGVNAIIGVLISSSLAAIIYAWKFGSLSSLWSFVYGFYFFVALSWIRPYALITPHKAGWLTRQIKSKPSSVVEVNSVAAA
ncbi:MAG: glycosyltransferase [Desulfamplus sp.]|nr:glycosyltransferase [Desulfamplus sp.]MBF0241035.1 glycosyltransferase [Desulfamplus sp.]